MAHRQLRDMSNAVLVLLIACMTGLLVSACQGPTQSARVACGSCEGQDRMVRLQPRSLSSGEKGPQFAHPISLSPEDWQLILRSIHVQKRDQMFLFFSTKGPVEPAFTDDEIDYLSAKFSRVFATVQPDERVVFALSRSGAPGVTEVTSGGWFVSGQSLHVVLANYRFAITMPTVRELLWQDPMWTQSGPSYDLVPVDHQEVVREEGSPRRLLTSPLPSLSVQYKELLVAESMPSPSVKNGPSAGQLSPQLSQTPPSNLSLEERLQRLKRLRDQGLITDEEYGAKRRELLERL